MTITIDGTAGITAPALTSTAGISSGTTVVAGSTVKASGYTVAGLPAAGTAGRRAYVTNALLPVWGSNVAGGGAVTVPVFDNGTTWIVG